MSLENKTMRAWLPKADKQACGWPGTKSSPTKRHFWGQCPSKVLSALGSLRFDPCVGSLWHIYTVLLPLCRARLYHYYTCVVVVHSCLCQALIRHEWGASLADVRLHSKSSHVAWGQNHAGLSPQSGQTSLRVARNKILPHSYFL